MTLREWWLFWVAATAMIFLAPWAAMCFIAWDIWWPLQNGASRLWLIVSASAGITIADKAVEESLK